MEHLIRAFRRVAADVDTPDAILGAFASFENDPSSLTDVSRRRILDFPDPDPAQPSSLRNPDLLKRAANTPQDLTDSEVNVLAQRYWPEARPRKYAKARWAAMRALGDDGFEDVSRQVEEIQRRAYEDEDEARAIENATRELGRRREVALRESQRRDDEAGLARARPWVRRLWDELEASGGRHWGYAAYVTPGIVGEARENYFLRSETVVQNAQGVVGCGGMTLRMKWMVQKLDWPANVAAHDEKAGLDEGVLEESFRRLRDDFASVRENKGLLDGVQRNVILVIDRYAVDSVLRGSGNVDEMWVWALDPDYTADTTRERTTGGSTYEGYLRVRLQQIAHNFFDLRHFQEVEHSMEDLWRAAQGSREGLFVSVKPEEIGLWTRSRDVGSALRVED